MEVPCGAGKYTDRHGHIDGSGGSTTVTIT